MNIEEKLNELIEKMKKWGNITEDTPSYKIERFKTLARKELERKYKNHTSQNAI